MRKYLYLVVKKKNEKVSYFIFIDVLFHYDYFNMLIMLLSAGTWKIESKKNLAKS